MYFSESFTVSIKQLPGKRAAALPTSAFRPHHQHLAIRSNAKPGMLTPFAVSRSVHWNRVLFCEVLEIYLAAGLPSPDDAPNPLGERHAAHRASIDVPAVELATREAPSVIERSQEEDIAVGVLGCRAVQSADGSLAVGEQGHSTAAAGASRFSPSR